MALCGLEYIKLTISYGISVVRLRHTKLTLGYGNGAVQGLEAHQAHTWLRQWRRRLEQRGGHIVGPLILMEFHQSSCKVFLLNCNLYIHIFRIYPGLLSLNFSLTNHLSVVVV